MLSLPLRAESAVRLAGRGRGPAVRQSLGHSRSSSVKASSLGSPDSPPAMICGSKTH